MTDPRLALSYAAKLPRVFGRQLRPFSLAHCRTLDLLESPFAGCGHRGRLDFAETLLAVLVCSRPAPEEGQPLFARRHRLLNLCTAWRWGRRLRTERAAFLSYLEEAQSGPECYDANGAGRSKLAAWQALYTRLRAGGFGKDEAWAVTPGRAAWIIAGLDEAAGHEPNIIGEAEMEALRQAGYEV